MIEGAKLYGRMAAASIRSLMQYKFSFIINSCVYTLVFLVEFATACVVLYHFKSIGGWTFVEIAALYGLVSASVSIVRVLCREIHHFDDYIVRGEFDGLLLRPWPTLLLLMGRQVDIFKASGVVQGLVVLGVSLHFKGHIGTLGVWLYPYLILLLIAGAIILFSMEVMISSVAFWVARTGDLRTFLFYGPTFAGLYPLSVYPKLMRGFLTVWPVAFLGFIPIRYIFGYGGSEWSLVAPLFAAVLSVTVALLAWRSGERAYYSTGS